MIGLLDILDSKEFGGAARYELLRFDRRPEQLGTDDLPWVDAQVIIRYADEKSPLGRAVNPDFMWGLQEQLMAEMVDTLHWLKWAKTEAARHRRGMPEPLPRPGVEKKEVIGDVAVDIDDLDDLLGWGSTDN